MRESYRFPKKWYSQPITPLLNFLYTIFILNLCFPVSLVPTLCIPSFFCSTHHTRTHHGSYLFACSISCTYLHTILYHPLYYTIYYTSHYNIFILHHTPDTSQLYYASYIFIHNSQSATSNQYTISVLSFYICILLFILI